MGDLLWWLFLAVVVFGVLPVVALLALRIVRGLQVIEAAAKDIRASLQGVAGGVPPAVAALTDVAAGCERLAEQVSV